ncbi:hypothetical protein IFM46972_05266 [Aspergillus udagawae]|uniref:Uncharacterized protein n=1 Tax=Aspergillus udagawae TaxID=91492 RepID=A0A8H3NPS8_9EURO|nr:hypothetical protein IFM46972_05266 [Aspergillus udagawae]
MVVENARANDRLRKAGEVPLGTLLRIKAGMGRFGVGQRDRVTMWGNVLHLHRITNMMREDEDVSNACFFTTRFTANRYATTWSPS